MLDYTPSAHIFRTYMRRALSILPMLYIMLHALSMLCCVLSLFYAACFRYTMLHAMLHAMLHTILHASSLLGLGGPRAIAACSFYAIPCAMPCTFFMLY